MANHRHLHLNNHTWSIHSLSPFTTPLPSPPCRNSRTTTNSSRLESSATTAWRRHRRLSSKATAAATADTEGDYVRFKWVNVASSSLSSTLTASNDDDTHSRENLKKKRKRKPPQRHSLPSERNAGQVDTAEVQQPCQQVEQQEHLYVEIMAEEEFSAGLLLCFPSYSSNKKKINKRPSATVRRDDDDDDDDDGNNVSSFLFCLRRGRKSSCEFLWQWIESTTGCLVGRQAFCPRTDELVCAVALWTQEAYYCYHHHHRYYHRNNNRGHQGQVQTRRARADAAAGDDTDSVTAAADLAGDDNNSTIPKPLVMTFAVPTTLQGKGLDTLSVTIPQAALYKLCYNVEKRRPVTTSMKQSKRSRRARKDVEDDNDIDSEIQQHQQLLPIFPAIQSYIQEAFHIDITSFSLVKASCDAALFGCDGRCKLQNDNLMSLVIEEIASMVRRRYANTGATTTAMAALQNHKENQDDDDDDSDDS